MHFVFECKNSLHSFGNRYITHISEKSSHYRENPKGIYSLGVFALYCVIYIALVSGSQSTPTPK